MSAILSSDDLNDFISPGVACIKPVETLPLQQPPPENPYEVTTEDKLSPPAAPAQISLTDCLACSGCVTSAEAILVSLQSHDEVLKALDSSPSIPLADLRQMCENALRSGGHTNDRTQSSDRKVFVASLSPQVRASLTATYGVSEAEAGHMVEQLLAGPEGLQKGGVYGNGFAWVVDTNPMRDLGLVAAAEEFIAASLQNPCMAPRKPILTSACPGWVCYAEKTHPHVLPHLSRLKSPQALTGTLLKSVLSRSLNINPDQIWHLAIMPCFDKKLEASRQELTDLSWQSTSSPAEASKTPSRDVDCVITARELLMLADTRGISFPLLPRNPLFSSSEIFFPDETTKEFLFKRKASSQPQKHESGTSGGFLYHILCSQQSMYPGSTITSQRGRNADVVDYAVDHEGKALFRAARYYGFRNIQNLVRKLKPSKASRLPGGKFVAAKKPHLGKSDTINLDYVEVMACPGGCTNGGGQIKLSDLGDLQGAHRAKRTQKEWLAAVDEAYYSMEEADDISSHHTSEVSDPDFVNGLSTSFIKDFLSHWAQSTDVDVEKLIFTSYREVESDVGKNKPGQTEHAAELASKIGGGW